MERYMQAIVLLAILAIGGLTGSALLAGENNQLNERIDLQENEIDSLSTQVQTLEANVNSLTENLEITLSELEASEAEVESLKEQLEEAEDVETPEVPEEPTGEVFDELRFGDTVEFTLDDGDLDQLSSGEFAFDGDDYEYEQEFFSTSDLRLVTNGFGYDEEFGDEPRLVTLDEGAVGYRFIFEDPVDVADVGFDEPLEIPFLGNVLTLVSVDSSEVDIQVGRTLNLLVGEVVDVDGVEVELLGVSENDKIQLRVGSDTDIIDVGSTEELGDTRVRVVETFYSSTVQFAEVVIGTDTTEEQENGDEYVFDEYFRFDYTVANGELTEIVLTYDVKADEVDDDVPAFSVGDVIEFPGNFVTVEFLETTDVEYLEYEFVLDDVDAQDDLQSDSNALIVTGEDESIVIDGEEVDEVIVLNDGSVYYYNEDGDLTLATDTEFVLENDDYEATVEYVGGQLQIVEETNGVITAYFDIANQRLGVTGEDAEADDVTYDGATFGTSEYNVLTADGLVLVDVENYAEDDEFVLRVPSEVVEATVVVA